LTFKSTSRSTVAVVTTMRIKELAERSGFSAPTLRYYEELGLLPEPARTPAGYRTYDEATVERLAFIARAKQLGCSLGEIGELTTAWEGGRCGPVQDRLRTLVAAKLADAQAQIVELMTLSSDLQRAAASLELHRPDGPCDDECGCVTDTVALADASQTFAVSLTAKPAAPAQVEVPIACTLRPDALRGQVEDWQALMRHADRRVAMDDGVRVELGAGTPVQELMRLVAAEQECCQFLRFAITVDTRGVGLEVRGPADARMIIESLFGVAA
jgi:MerR family transcriptional regulator, copper efflux regulator